MKRVVVLIDGQNLFYALRQLGLKELEIDWNKIFQSFLEPSDELTRAYWFRPQKIFNTPRSASYIRKKVVYKFFSDCYQQFKAGNFHEIPQETLNEIEVEAKKIETWIHEQHTKFSHFEYIYDQLCLNNNDIEIVKKGVVKINPFTRRYIGEKGVDIALAGKMVALSAEKKCDKIILISGDYDYAEAISYIKNNMTKLNIVRIQRGEVSKNRYMSRDLLVLADKIIHFYETDIRKNYLK